MNRWAFILVVFSSVPVFTGAQATASGPAQAIALEGQGKLAESAEAWRAIVKQNPADAEAFASLGFVLSKQGRYAEAVPAYRRAIALNPKLSGLQLNLGLAEFKQGHFQAAVLPLNAALSSDPHNLQVRVLLGMSYYGSEQFARATEYLADAAKADPANLELRQVLAQSCLFAKKYSCALDAFHQILLEKPDSAAVHVLYGEALDGLDRTPEAIAEFQAAVKAAPQLPDVHFGLGYLYWKMLQFNKAKEEFERELALYPDQAQALAYLGDVEYKTGNQEKGLDLLQKALRRRDNIRIAYLDSGAIFAQQRRYPEAIDALKRAVDLDPTQPEAYFLLGRAYQGSGNRVEADKQFAKTRTLQKGEVDKLATQMFRPATPSL
jgi:tetratricopeptide (TPR) repeat protein